MEVTKEQIEELLNKALKRFYKKDSCLVDMVPGVKQDNGGHHVGERAIVFRLAHYMQNIMDKMPVFKGYVLDCEYNRDGTDIKKLQEKCVYPDVIIHQRQNNENNLLVMEVKTYWNNDTGQDMKKIEKFMDPDGNYKYKFGVSLIIERQREKMSFEVLSESDNLCL
ncbi:MULTISPECIES: hypothetical protein [unclassified Candidatus Paralachnospira]|uniref:hypothetical protein n=1 Tax=unclassified Candidatus Paralachnospira TaxID=3099471 RepID=UPI003F910D82